jgi:NAD(P)-dependent dehydrogenase (short-subunit alcohol dehydrogenase family)
MAKTSQIALVTGGSRGLGRSTALALARKGVDVVFTYHSARAEADAVAAEIAALGRKAAALQLDAGAIRSLDDFVAEFRRALAAWDAQHFDFLVNNAGMGKSGLIADFREEDFDLLMNTHFKGVFFLTQKLLPLIRDGGRIVNVSSGLTRFSIPGSATYAAMKGAIEVFTRFLALELGPRQITVNTVAPGAIATDFGGGWVRDNAQVNQRIAAETALGRVGVADDIGPMIASLLSDDNRWLNGQRIEVSGGTHL